MQHEFVLTPKELYFLGSIFRARYIDYAYISAMDDIQKRYQLHRREALRHLTELGLLREDFTGEITVSAPLQQALRPVFFGPTETVIQLYQARNARINTWRLHHLAGRSTMVTMGNDRLYLRAAEAAAIDQLIRELTPVSATVAPIRPLEREYVRHMVTVRQATVGSPAHEEIWLEQDGLLFRDGPDPEMTYLTSGQFAEHMGEILKGEFIWA